MTYDADRKRILLVGSSDINARFQQTWEWDGRAWTQRFPVVSPDADSIYSEVCFDTRRGVAVLHNGRRGQTWEWDGTNWTQRQANSPPGWQAEFSLAFDQQRGRTIMWRGDGLWEWNGSVWTKRDLPREPASPGALVYDAFRRGVVLLARPSGGKPAETWFYDGFQWSLLLTREQGPVFGTMVWDGKRNCLVVVGPAGSELQAWEFCRAPYATFGDGCIGTHGLPKLRAVPGQWPIAGSSFSVEVTNLPPTGVAYMVVGLSRDDWLGVHLPLPLDFLGMIGCSAYTDHVRVFPIVSVGGRAVWSTLVWNDVGRSFYNQAFVLDPGANAFGLITSNGGAGVIGR